MSERISIRNSEDEILKLKEPEATLKKESKNKITFFKVDSEKGKMIEMEEPKLHKEFKVITPSIQSGDLFTLRLGKNATSTFNLLEKGEHSCSSQNLFVELSPKQEVKEFPCLFCNKKISNSQALGGHQNTHRRERVFKKMELKRREEEMNSTLRCKPNFSYLHPYSDPIHYQGYSYFCGNLQHPADTQMNNGMPFLLGSSSGGYGGMYMPNTPSSPPPFFMQVPKPSLTPPYLRMTNFLGGNQTHVLSIPQRPDTVELRLSSQANQILSSSEGTERNSNAKFLSHDLPMETRNFIGGNQLLAEANVSSSSTTESTSEELDLNLKL